MKIRNPDLARSLLVVVTMCFHGLLALSVDCAAATRPSVLLVDGRQQIPPAGTRRTPARVESVFAPEEPVSRFKKQALQKIDFALGGLSSTDGDVDSAWFKISLTAGMPIRGDLDNLVGITPSFRVDWLSADSSFDLPDEVYTAGASLLWRRRFNERWAFFGNVQPAVRSDFTTSQNAFRTFALAIWTWQAVPEEFEISFGAVHLGRNDIGTLPALGVKWTPDSRTAVELGLPRSRIAKRIAKDGSRSELWTYLSGAIGGNTWAVTRSDGRTDELSLRDLRAMVGIERVVDGGGGWFVEGGYAFSRRLEFESEANERSLSDSFAIQGGWAW